MAAFEVEGKLKECSFFFFLSHFKRKRVIRNTLQRDRCLGEKGLMETVQIPESTGTPVWPQLSRTNGGEKELTPDSLFLYATKV